MKYFAKIKYLGTDFHGFQVQPGLRTVQGELCRALSETLGVPVSVTGCSRTDRGVHANEMCITVLAEGASVPPDRLAVAAARYLPPDISVFFAEEAAEDFHPRYDVYGKEYLYKIVNSRTMDPFLVGRAWFLPRRISDEGLLRMRRASEYILGRHDFSAFMAEGSDTEDTVREVRSLTVDRIGENIEIRISADGFLYNMVRIIVGTLTEVAFGRIEPEALEKIIASRDRQSAGVTAPPDGLYLNRVFYGQP